MKTRMQWWIILSAIALLAFACDDSTGTEGPNNLVPDATTDTVMGGNMADMEADTMTGGTMEDMEEDMAPPPPGRLELVTMTNMQGGVRIETNSSNVPVVVRYVTESGDAIADAPISFTITASDNDCAAANPACITPGMLGDATTTADGQATMTYSVAGMPADVTVEVAVAIDGTMVEPLTVTLQIRDADAYDLVVDWNYAPTATPREFDVVTPALYQIEPPESLPGFPLSCDQVWQTNPPRSASDDIFLPVSIRTTDTARNPDNTIETTTFTNLDTGSRYLVIGYALAPDNATLTVYGCAELMDPIGNSGNSITVDLNEVPIIFSPNPYDLTTVLDLSSTLTGTTAGDVVDQVFGFFMDPAQQVWDWADLALMAAGTSLPSGLEGIAVPLIDSAIMNFAPQWLQDALTIGNDISTALTNFTLGGTLHVVNPPAMCPDGMANNCLTMELHSYTSVSFPWTLNPNALAPTCQPTGTNDVTCDIVDITGDPVGTMITGNWDGQLVNDTLIIESHAISIPYGRILRGIIEKVAIPAIYGDPSINSFEALIRQLLVDLLVDPMTMITPGQECQAVGEGLADLVGSQGGFLRDVVVSAGAALCDAGVDYGVNELNQLIDGLVFDSADAFTIGTAMACPLADTDGDLIYDQMGTAAMPCTWTVVIRLNATETVNLTGTFTAVAQ